MVFFSVPKVSNGFKEKILFSSSARAVPCLQEDLQLDRCYMPSSYHLLQALVDATSISIYWDNYQPDVLGMTILKLMTLRVGVLQRWFVAQGEIQNGRQMSEEKQFLHWEEFVVCAIVVQDQIIHLCFYYKFKTKELTKFHVEIKKKAKWNNVRKVN